MRRRYLAALGFMSIFVLLAAAVVGCAPAAVESDVSSVYENIESDGLPSVLPADHQGRFESGGYEMCASCHLAGPSGEPVTSDARVVPMDHYVDGDPATMTFDPNRSECITCHSSQ